MEEAAAAQYGSGSPPGLLSTQQFRHVWRSLGVKMSREQAAATFLRHGCDGQGLLPYEVFAAKLQVGGSAYRTCGAWLAASGGLACNCCMCNEWAN